MNAKKTLKKYIGPSAGKKLLAWLLSLATLATFGLGIKQSTVTDDVNDAVVLDSYSAEVGDFVYVDVLGVSDWILELEQDSVTTTYYTVFDKSGYLHIAIFEDSDIRTMSDQEQFWNDLLFSDSVDTDAESVRVYGVAEKIPAEYEDDLREYLDMSSSEFDDYLGAMLINATRMPSDNSEAPYIAIGCILLVLSIFVIVSNARSKSGLKKSLKRLEQLGELDAAAAELNGTVKVIGKDKVRISDNYVFSKHLGAAVRIDDILWAYRSITYRKGRVDSTSLPAHICTGKTVTLARVNGNDRKDLTGQIMEALAEANPAILLGIDEANHAEYKAMLQEYKASGTKPADSLKAAEAAAAAAQPVAAEVAAEPVAEAVAEAAAEPVAEAAEAVAETAAEPVAEAAEAVAETAAEPVVEAAAEAASDVKVEE